MKHIKRKVVKFTIKKDETKDLTRVIQNSNLLWDNTNDFFRELPTSEKIDEILDFKIPSDNNAMYVENDTSDETHWSVIFNDFAKNLGNEDLKLIKKYNTRNKIKDIDEYWILNQAPFKVEYIQMYNDSILHRTICSLVITHPIKLSKKYKRKRFNREISLIPSNDHGSYVSINFETRLLMEFESIGLISTEKCEDEIINYDENINKCLSKIESLVPFVNSIKESLKSIIPDVKQRHEEMIERSRLLSNNLRKIE